MSRSVTVLEVDGPPDERGQALLAQAELVIAARAQIAEVRGLIPRSAVVDLLPDAALDDPDGHRWDIPVEPDDVVILLPPGDLARRVAERFASPAAVTVIGLDGRPLSEPAKAALGAARVVAGGAWHLDLVDPEARRVVIGADLDAVVDELVPGPAVVLASGDPGFFGIVRALRDRFGEVAVHPAVSSVARICAAAGVSWDDALVVSAHGRDPARAVNACRRHPKVVVLTAPDFGPLELVQALGGLPREYLVGERLGLPDERIGPLGDRPADPNVVLVTDPAATEKGWAWPQRRAPYSWALDEDLFEASAGMVTKAEVRALALAWLGPGVGDLVWDVGAGSGSVAIECARLGAAAIAVERDAQACARIRGNAERHGVPVELVEGGAPAALADLPDPDAVFVGGGGDDLPAILEAAAARGPRVVVAALATVERVALARAALAAAGLGVDGTLLQASRLAPLGTGTRFAALNPVVLLRGRR